jgi:NAD(P)-dependent dehydrogenase (short-subunit alcohol dehydrogenase family)
MTARFEGKAAIVTGAGQGLGEAVARRISEEGGRVMVVDINGENAERVAADLPGDAIGVRADVGDPNDVTRYTELAVERFGQLDCVHNNAGIIGAIAMLADIDVEDFERTMWVNVRGTFLGTRAAMRAMAASGGGAIVNTSSVMRKGRDSLRDEQARDYWSQPLCRDGGRTAGDSCQHSVSGRRRHADEPAVGGRRGRGR